MADRVVHRNMFRIVGMSRSGNHAIVSWILVQLEGRWCFLNCVEPRTNPFLTARPTDDGRCFETNDPDFDIEAHAAGQVSPKDYLLLSQEDTFLNPALGQQATAIHTAAVGCSERWLDVIILRDPYNLFASRRRLGFHVVSDHAMVRIWRQHARAFLGEIRNAPRPTVAISYNAWVRDRGYRRRLADVMGLRFTDDRFARIARCAGGSSFDGYRFDGDARRMGVFDRWRHYWHDADFRRLFDRETEQLSRRIFGRILPGDNAPVKEQTPDRSWRRPDAAGAPHHWLR